ncbi:MAG: substrate-binding domain-containing protein [Nitrososphaeria archaeon]
MSRLIEKGTAFLLASAVLAILLLYVIFLGLSSMSSSSSTAPKKVFLKIATTTSLDATGLLDDLKKIFEKDNPYINLTWVAVGTGQAIEIGKRGDADMILVHNRAMEQQFIDEGYGVHGVTFAYNDFIILGPKEDVVGVGSCETAVEAFKKIAEAGASGNAVFVSRGDRSGTNMKELEIWTKAGVDVLSSTWYRETGQGMAQTLRLASNLGCYTLSDKATWYTLASELNLKVVFEGDPELLNLYRVFQLNQKKYPSLHHSEAEKFILFLISPETQAFIGNYTRGGQKLFSPAFGRLSQLGVKDVYEDQEVTYWRMKLER